MVTNNDTTRTTASALPDDLESMASDLRLASILASVDRAALSDHDMVRLMVARDRMVSHLQAERVADVAEVARRSGADDDLMGEFAHLEVAAALRLTRTAAQHEVGFALTLTERLPQVAGLLAAGRVDMRRARVLVEGTLHLDAETARRVVAELADRAGELTTGQLRARLRKLCLVADSDDATRRLEHAVQDRRLVLEDAAFGTANLMLLDLPPDLAAAARERIDHLARSLPSDGRTMDQRRADVAIDLLCGHGRPAGRGVVDLTVDLGTLLGLNDNPGELGGWGPVVADIARQITDRQIDGRWIATVTDHSGDPLTMAVRRRPTTTQARQVKARHRTCVFPGCRHPARSGDLDHTTRHVDGGATLESNLAPLCRHHHRAKDETNWHYRRRDDGTHLWTSPLGHTYTTSGRSP